MARSETDRGWSGWLRYGLPGLVLGLGLAWTLEGRGPTALAQTPPGSGVPPMMAPSFGPASERSRGSMTAAVEAPESGTIAMTVPAGNGSSAQFLYLIDTRARALAIYRVDPSNTKGMVKLEAARQYQWDLKLAQYNNLPPEVAAIESTVRSLGQQPSR